MKQNLLKEMEAGSKNALLKKRIITHYTLIPQHYYKIFFLST